MAAEQLVITEEMDSQVTVMAEETVERFVVEEVVAPLGSEGGRMPWPLTVFEPSYLLRDRRKGETYAEFGYRRGTLTGG